MNKSTIFENQWDAAKSVLRGKLIAIQVFHNKQEKSQITNLNSHLKELEKEELTKSQTIRIQKTIKIRAEINKLVTKNR